MESAGQQVCATGRQDAQQTMSETTEQRTQQGGDGRPQQPKQKEEEEKPGAVEEGGDVAPAGQGQGAAAPPAVHEPAPPKRTARTPPQSAPKRATRASTGAPIALTAKGSLYKAKKDIGERPCTREEEEASAVVATVLVGFFKMTNDF